MGLTVEQRAQVSRYVKDFRHRYLETPKGQEHLTGYARERQEVQAIFVELRSKRDSGQSIEEDVLYRLLPYSNTKHNREQGHRVSTWPAVTKDIKTWHEGAKWQLPENWPKVADAIFELVVACAEGPEQSDFEHFAGLEFIKGFEAGMLSPIFYCLRPDLLVLNSKNRDTVNFLFSILEQPERVDCHLINYLDNVVIIRRLLHLLNEPLFDSYDVFDMFCHFMCAKRLGGDVRAPKTKPTTGRNQKAPPEAGEIGTLQEQRSHSEIQWMLIKLGVNLGCDVWIARNDQGKSFKGEPFNEHTLARLPRLGFDQDTTRIIELIDVLWLKGSAIVAAFEIEHTTSIYSGILRLADLITMQPNVHVDLFIVASRDRYDKVVRELNRPTFSSYSLHLHERCKFFAYEDVNKVLQDTSRYAGYMEAKVIYQVAQSCRKLQPDESTKLGVD